MSSTDQPKPATRSSKRNKRPSNPVLEFLSNARKKRGGGIIKESIKDANVRPSPYFTSATSSCQEINQEAISVQAPSVVTASSTDTVQAPSVDTTTSTSTLQTPDKSQDITATSTVTASINTATQDQSQAKKSFPFKNPHFSHLGKSHSAKKAKSWKSLKQILTTERSLTLNSDHVTYATIDAPPSFKPTKKYSDLSGFEAKYTDPQTKLRFSNPQEFAQLRILPSDTVASLLSLRKAQQEVS